MYRLKGRKEPVGDKSAIGGPFGDDFHRLLDAVGNVLLAAEHLGHRILEDLARLVKIIWDLNTSNKIEGFRSHCSFTVTWPWAGKCEPSRAPSSALQPGADGTLPYQP